MTTHTWPKGHGVDIDLERLRNSNLYLPKLAVSFMNLTRNDKEWSERALAEAKKRSNDESNLVLILRSTRVRNPAGWDVIL